MLCAGFSAMLRISNANSEILLDTLFPKLRLLKYFGINDHFSIRNILLFEESKYCPDLRWTPNIFAEISGPFRNNNESACRLFRNEFKSRLDQISFN